MSGPSEQAVRVPLCVDLDGTYVRSDTTWEMLGAYLLRSPLAGARVLWWLVKGREVLKAQLWRVAPVDVSSLPRNPLVAEWLRREGDSRELILVSDAPQDMVNALVARDDVFRRGFGSAPDTNLTRSQKADRLIGEFGIGGFDYVGNSRDDFRIWKAARHAYGVNLASAVRRMAQRDHIDLADLGSESADIKAWLRAFRVRHWIKNLLCIVPVLAGHRWGDAHVWTSALLVFATLCVGSSFIYLCNDLSDLSADRRHPSKRMRPLAFGAISVRQASAALLVLLLLWVAGAIRIGRPAAWFLGGQMIGSLLYSGKVKALPIMDVIWLGLLYCNRIVVGGTAIGINLTAWLMAFALFFFIGLACVKRFNELARLPSDDRELLPGRGYLARDTDMLRHMGYGSSLMSVLVLALYIGQPVITELYPSPDYLWLLCIILFYWVTRLWMRANRQEGGSDPMDLALGDRATYVCLVLGLITLVAAMNRLG